MYLADVRFFAPQQGASARADRQGRPRPVDGHQAARPWCRDERLRPPARWRSWQEQGQQGSAQRMGLAHEEADAPSKGQGREQDVSGSRLEVVWIMLMRDALQGGHAAAKRNVARARIVVDRSTRACLIIVCRPFTSTRPCCLMGSLLAQSRGSCSRAMSWSLYRLILAASLPLSGAEPPSCPC